MKFAGQEAGTVDDIGAFLNKKWEHFQQILGVILEVRVVDNHDVSIGVRQSGSEGRAFSLVLLMAEEEPLEFGVRACFDKGSARLFECGGRRIAGGIVHDDDLNAMQVGRLAEDAQAGEARGHEVLFVEYRDKYGE